MRRAVIRLAVLGSALMSALVLAACVSAPTADPARLPAGEWSLDPAHARVTWQVRHLGLSWYTARFDRAQARLSFDPERPEASALTAIVEAASVSTGDPAFDDTLRGPGWLDAADHPELVFVAERIEVTGARTGRVHGALTIRGVTRPAVLETEFQGGLFNPLTGRQTLGFSAQLRIDRTEFGVGRLPGNFIGDSVRVQIESEFVKD